MDCADPTTGLIYDTKVEVQQDACNDCGGHGRIHYSTFADYRAFIVERNQRDVDMAAANELFPGMEHSYYDEDYFEPKKSGSRHCERCNGTGVFKGDGGKINVRMTWSGKIIGLPNNMFEDGLR